MNFQRKATKPASILIVTFYLVFGFAFSVWGFSINDKLNGINNNKREQWIKQKTEQLMNFIPTDTIPILNHTVTDIEGFYQSSWRLKGEGIVRFESGEWVYMVSNSSHTDEIVGDITLAIDNKKQIFFNEGHVCGGIINFVIKQKTENGTTEKFFELSVCDTDDKVWIRLK